MSKLIPLEDHVLVEPIEEEQVTKGWIVLPDTAKDKPQKGRVIAVWKGKILDNWQRAPMDVEEGDIVYFTKYAPDELEIVDDNWERKKLLVIRHSSILAKESK
jgi:chaperonin GroES